MRHPVINKELLFDLTIAISRPPSPIFYTIKQSKSRAPKIIANDTFVFNTRIMSGPKNYTVQWICALEAIRRCIKLSRRVANKTLSWVEEILTDTVCKVLPFR